MIRISLICSLLLACAAWVRADDNDFVAQLVDGSRVEGPRVEQWENTQNEPRLKNKNLYDKNNPVRWLIDRRLEPGSTPEAFVEMFGGDRLPGRAVEYRWGTEDPFHKLPAHLLVNPAALVQFPDYTPPRHVRVLTRWIRRVVWQSRGTNRYEPGTAFLRDGRQLSFRSVRWRPGDVQILREDGTQTISLANLAELHLPQIDPLQAHFEQLAILTPEAEQRWMQWEMTDGTQLTSSQERFQAKSRGGGDPNKWFHMLQPAWCLDPIWVQHRRVRVRRWFAADEVPLSLLEAADCRQQNMLGSGWHWQVDRNVRGNRLLCNREDFGWGIGVHAQCELTFELPWYVKSFRTRVGLDQSAGTGGCAQGQVFWGAKRGSPAFESKLLVGTGEVFDTGRMELKTARGKSERLVLVADMAHKNRPQGADPFDIRDTVNWLEPLLELDHGYVVNAIRRAGSRLIPAWRGWAVERTGGGELKLANHWDETDQRDPRYQLEVTARERLLRLSRTFTVEPDQKWLVLVASRYEQGTSPSNIQVTIDGEPAGKFEVPKRNSRADPQPLFVSLHDYRGLEIKVEITQLPEGEKSLVDWRAIAVTGELPGLLPLLEDDGAILTQMQEGEGQSAMVEGPQYSGVSCAKVAGGRLAGANLPDLDAAIRDVPRLGEFRYIRFAWKKQGGTEIKLELAHSGAWGKAGKRTSPAYRYRMGSGEPREALAVERKLSEEWVVVTRDLYADFGNFNLTGLGFDAVDGDFALFDHVYLARTQEDFQYIDAAIGDNDSRPATIRLNGRTGEEAQHYAEASMHLKQAMERIRTKQYVEAREYLEKVFALTTKNSPLRRRAEKLLGNIK